MVAQLKSCAKNEKLMLDILRDREFMDEYQIRCWYNSMKQKM